MTMNKFNEFKKEFENLSKIEQVKIYNNFCDKNGLEDEKIYPMEKFDEVFADVKPSKIFEWIWCNPDMIDFGDSYFVKTYNGFKTINNPYYDMIQYHIKSIFEISKNISIS